MYPRFIQERVNNALEDTRVVLIAGPRQAGKTTFVQNIVNNNRPYFTLDNVTTLDAARQDPVGFIREIDCAIIDEVQRVPELLLAIKESVDNDQRPGRFLLTGSANLMTLPRVADSLAGRMEVIQLMPLAQSELRGVMPAFLDKVFNGQAPTTEEAVVGKELVARVLAGGYPEALNRKTWSRRQDWYLNYLDAIIHRDVKDIAQVEQIQQLHNLILALAHYDSKLINYSEAGSRLGMNHVITRRYAGILEQVFLAFRLQAWHSNQLKRLTKTPKLHFLDTGLLAALQAITPEKIATDRKLFGPLLETFVLTELLKLTSWSEQRIHFSHFRDKQKNEVDVVMQDRGGQIVGIEVKASATVTRADFSGLHKLAEASKSQFTLGLVLYDHDKVIPFGDRMYAVPISALWH